MPLIEAVPDALARVYADALFDLARDESKGVGGNGDAGTGRNRAEEILGELEDIIELARQNPKFAELLGSRIIPKHAKDESLRKVFEKRISDLTLRFLLVVNEKNRLGHLPSMIAAFSERVQTAFGRVEVDVYTAAPIGPEEVREIRDRLQALMKREPVVHTYVEPAMIGGIKVQIGDQLIDSSVRSSLRRMRDQLTSNTSSSIRARADKLIEG